MGTLIRRALIRKQIAGSYSAEFQTPCVRLCCTLRQIQHTPALYSTCNRITVPYSYRFTVMRHGNYNQKGLLRHLFILIVVSALAVLLSTTKYVPKAVLTLFKQKPCQVPHMLNLTCVTSSELAEPSSARPVVGRFSLSPPSMMMV